jgi:hypothetical protein
MVAVIQERLSVQDARNRSYIEWQTKALASFIANTASSKKTARELLRSAHKLSMLPKDDTSSDSSQRENGRASNTPRAGSYERLMAGFGQKG